jgi:hypothetical protein
MNTKLYDINTIDRARWNSMALEKSIVCQTYEWALAHHNSMTNEAIFIVAENNGKWVGVPSSSKNTAFFSYM